MCEQTQVPSVNVTLATLEHQQTSTARVVNVTLSCTLGADLARFVLFSNTLCPSTILNNNKSKRKLKKKKTKKNKRGHPVFSLITNVPSGCLRLR